MTPSLRPQPAALDETLLEPKPTARTTPGEAPIGLGADACYWAILEHLPDRLSDYALLAAFEQWLPLPIDEIEARFVRLGDGKVIACGVEHALLQSLIEQIDDVSLCPTTVPAFVQDAADGIDVAKMMEFRRGQYVPSRMAHRRRRQHAGAIALALVTCVIVAGGFWLRAQSAQAQAHAATMATSMLVDAALGLAAGAATGLDPAQRLDAALRVVNQTQQLGAMAPGDQAPNYGQLLAAWPPSVRAQVSRLTIDEGSIRIDAELETAEDAERVVRELDRALSEWTIGSRNIRKARSGVQLTMALVPAAKEPTP